MTVPDRPVGCKSPQERHRGVADGDGQSRRFNFGRVLCCQTLASQITSEARRSKIACSLLASLIRHDGRKTAKSDPPVLSLAAKPVLHDKGKPTAGCLLHPKPVKRVVPSKNGLLRFLAGQTFYECLGDRSHSPALVGKPAVS